MPGKNDFANYRKMSEPFDDAQAANDALEKFFALVAQARKDCRIMDVHVICKVPILKDESEGQAFASAHFGSTIEGANMCAWSLGNEQANMQALIAQYMKAGK